MERGEVFFGDELDGQGDGGDVAVRPVALEVGGDGHDDEADVRGDAFEALNEEGERRLPRLVGHVGDEVLVGDDPAGEFGEGRVVEPSERVIGFPQVDFGLCSHGTSVAR